MNLNQETKTIKNLTHTYTIFEMVAFSFIRVIKYKLVKDLIFFSLSSLFEFFLLILSFFAQVVKFIFFHTY